VLISDIISSCYPSVILPLRRFRLSEEQLEHSIPTLSDRQFVVDKTGMSSSEARLQRELFWYREELFKAVRGRWQESGGARSGELFLRRQRMTLPMLETLRTETARVKLMLEHLPEDEQAKVSAVATDRFSLTPNQFCLLRAKVTNLSCTRTLSVHISLATDTSRRWATYAQC
jgi:trafficking protein particle complex subunit 9